MEDDMCRIPAEVIKTPGFSVSVFGGDLITADSVYIAVDASGLISGVTPPTPTPTVYNQLVNTVESERAAAEAAADEAAASAASAAQSVLDAESAVSAAIGNSISAAETAAEEAAQSAIEAAESAQNIESTIASAISENISEAESAAEAAQASASEAQNNAALSAQSVLACEESAENAALDADRAETSSASAEASASEAAEAVASLRKMEEKMDTVTKTSDFKNYHYLKDRVGGIRQLTVRGETSVSSSGSPLGENTVNPTVAITGKNLFDCGNMTSVTSVGITATYDSTTGIITLNGTKETGVALELPLCAPSDRVSFLGLANERYTLSTRTVSGTYSGTLQIITGCSSTRNTTDITTHSKLITCNLSKNTVNYKSATLTSANPYITHFWLSVSKLSSFVANNLQLKIQLENDSTYTDWEKPVKAFAEIPLVLRGLPNVNNLSNPWYASDKLVADAEKGTVILYREVSPMIDSVQFSTIISVDPDNFTYGNGANDTAPAVEVLDNEWAHKLLDAMENPGENVLSEANIAIGYGYNTKQYVDERCGAAESTVTNKISRLSAGQYTEGNIIVAAADGGIKDSGMRYDSIIDSFGAVQDYVRGGNASRLFSVGDRFTTSFGDRTMDFTVIGINSDTPANYDYTYSMTLMGSPLPDNMQFATPQAYYYADAPLPAGSYHLTVPEGYETENGGGQSYSFTLENGLPTGGVICIDWPEDTNASSMTVKTYATQVSVTALEETGVSAGTSGLELGSATSGRTNNIVLARFGSNVYSHSDIHKYLNSEDAKGSVWTSYNDFDRPPSWAETKNGFLYDLDKLLVAALGYSPRYTATSHLYTIPYPSEYCRVSLLSRTNVYGGDEQANSENAEYTYFANNSDLVSAGLGADANRIIEKGGSAVKYWLRTAEDYTSDMLRAVNTDGSITTLHANDFATVVPIITII